MLVMSASCSKPFDGDLPEPEQGPVSRADKVDTIAPVAHFDGTVLVLSRREYPSGVPEDSLSRFAPVDIAVAWGDSAKTDVRGKLSVWQVNRRFVWRADAEAWKDARVRAFGLGSANWHLIPADGAIRRKIEAVRKEDVVHITGSLVDVNVGSEVARSSVRRDDEGDGACEIILVESIEKVRG